MKLNLQITLLTLSVSLILCSCERSEEQANKQSTVSADKTIPADQTPMKVAAFNDVDKLVTTLSQNGIGKLKPWQNPMEMGYGSLTDYYPIGTSKVAYGLTNNLTYYLEGNENQAKNLLISLNINNPDEKKQALDKLAMLTSKTFKSLQLEIPDGLMKAIRSGTPFKADNDAWSTAFKLDQSKIETWKVLIISK